MCRQQQYECKQLEKEAALLVRTVFKNRENSDIKISNALFANLVTEENQSNVLEFSLNIKF